MPSDSSMRNKASPSFACSRFNTSPGSTTPSELPILRTLSLPSRVPRVATHVIAALRQTRNRKGSSLRREALEDETLAMIEGFAGDGIFVAKEGAAYAATDAMVVGRVARRDERRTMSGHPCCYETIGVLAGQGKSPGLSKAFKEKREKWVSPRSSSFSLARRPLNSFARRTGPFAHSHSFIQSRSETLLPEASDSRPCW